MQKAVCFMLCLCLCFLTGCGDSVWDEPVLKDGEEPVFRKGCELGQLDEAHLIEKAETIVCATVTKKAYPNMTVGMNDDGIAETEPCTIVYMTVTDALKGAHRAGEEISVVLGGNGITFIDGNIRDSGGYFQVGDTLLLFMKRMDETYYRQYNRRQYIRDKQTPYTICFYTRGILWLGEDGTLLHERNTTGCGLFTDCKTVAEMKEKYSFG